MSTFRRWAYRLLLAAFAAASAPCMAQQAMPSLLHPLFQDHAVLQRDQPIPVWGEAKPGARVSIAFAGQVHTTRADTRGHWNTTLPAIAAGGPYELIVSAGQATQAARDLLVGDVWLCAGQSNMELPVWRTLDAATEMASATHPDIRLFTVPKATAGAPQTSFNASVAWSPATPESVRAFSATCFYFARELRKSVNVPMGLIQSAWGGSRIEPWTSTAALRAQGGMDAALDILAQNANDPAGANRRWGEHWQQWWTTREGAVPGDAPWQPGGQGWHDAPATLSAWERWGVPTLADYNGMVWYRTQVTLTKEQAAQGATLELGAADETDVTWVNGIAVGSENHPGGPRTYPLPTGLLKAGINTVVINVLDTWGDGGLAGPTAAYAVRFADRTRVALDPQWQYRVSPGTDAPPLAPWHAATGMSTLYNGMIAPLGNYGLRGVLWYQGESNTGDGAAYADRLRSLRDDWRNRFGATLPLLIVQLANYGQPPEAPVESGWAQVRDAQRRVAAEDPHSGLAVAIDIGDAYDIHPPNKQEVGRRLARLARHVVYREQAVVSTGPTAIGAYRTPDGLRVRFDDVTGALVTTGAKGPIGVEICDADARHCEYADALIEGNAIRLRGPHASAAARVRYCWADGPVCTLRDNSGLPAGPFELLVTEEASPAPVYFDWFEYTGRDAAFESPLPAGHYRNPILAGFHADPSIVAANGRFYLVNSSFTYFPGIPVFESTDLVHWKQIGNVIERPSQLDFDGLSVSRGIFAPAISYHDGLFYVVTTAVDSGGNFIATARDPAGPWSDPHWLPGIDGIDPSLFFDDDGRVYLVNNDAPAGTPRYEGHRAIWMQQMDLAAFRPVGPRKVLIDGGVEPAKNPIWIEGPHVYKREGWYYLSDAEGGTGPQHSQVVLRSRDVWGPYVPYAGNPILTQRDLPADRPLPITNAGHADLVEGPDGAWWAVFLASRNYQQRHYNTGRETYLLPVEWRDGWPVILPAGQTIPYVVKAPSWMRGDGSQPPSTGNFTDRDEFDGAALGNAWLRVRVPKQAWATLRERPGSLALHPLPEGLETLRNPAFLGRRQQHLRFEASTAMTRPEHGIAAGLAAFQSEAYWYFLAVRSLGGDRVAISLEARDGGGITETLATRELHATTTLRLQITGNEGRYAFAFDTGDGHGWQTLADNVDGTVLSTDRAGGFVGTLLGPFARDERATRSK